MNEGDERIIKLLDEIRDKQRKSNDAYMAQLAKYEEDQNIFRQSHEQHQKELLKRRVSRVIIAVFLGIIALCMVISVVLRFMGK